MKLHLKERDSLNQLNDVDDNEFLCGSDREHDSLPDTGDYSRQSLCFPRNLQHKEEETTALTTAHAR